MKATYKKALLHTLAVMTAVFGMIATAQAGCQGSALQIDHSIACTKATVFNPSAGKSEAPYLSAKLMSARGAW